MPRVKGYPRRKYGGATTALGRRIRRGGANRVGRKLVKVGRMITGWKQGVNYASVKESYNLPVQAGIVYYFRDALADLNFDRAQAVAVAYQQYRIKYIKMTFKPNNDTYPIGGGGAVPNLWFMIDKTRSIPPGADANTFLSIGTKPIRLDDKSVIKAWKPAVLVGQADGPGGAIGASTLKVSPFLSTNGNANIGGAWVPDESLHHGAVFYVDRVAPGDVQIYNVTVEVMFEFRRPCWKPSEGAVEMATVNSGVITQTTYNPGGTA